MSTQNLPCRGKVLKPSSKPCKENITSKSSKRPLCPHLPTIHCHEEEICKLLFHTTDRPVNGKVFPSRCERFQDYKKENINDKNKSNDRNTGIKSKGNSEFRTSPVKDKERNLFKKSGRAKSVPLLKNQNLEDSIDSIPVKLSSDNDCRKKQQKSVKVKDDGKSVLKKKSSGHRRLTWDQLLRGETEDLRTPNNKHDDRRLEYKKNVNNCYTVYEDAKSNCNSQKHTNKMTGEDKGKENSFPSQELNDPLLEVLYVSDPVKSLDYLIKQLRDKIIKQPENDNLQKIILDMENALLKVSVENQVYSRLVQDKNVYNTGGIPSNAPSKSSLSDGSNITGKNSHLHAAQLQKRLEESCLFLQSLCMKQKENCHNHTREKEQLTLQLAESRRLLAIANAKERDYEVTIGQLRLKVQEAISTKDQKSQSEKELVTTVSKLKAEIEALPAFKEEVSRLKTRLKETAKEKEMLHSKLYLKDLEIEKLKVLLEVKENLNPVLRHNKNKQYKEYIESELRLDIPIENKDNSLLSLSTMTSCTQEKLGIACSSQTSSIPRQSPTPCNSWQQISSIYQRPSAASGLNHDIGDIFQNLKKKSQQTEPPNLRLEMPSSSSSFWSDNGEQDLNSKLIHSNYESETLSS